MQGMDFAKYEDFLNKLKVGISIFDDNGTFLYVSNEILRTSGRSRADYIGKNIHEFIEKGIYEKSIVDIVYQTKMPRSFCGQGHLPCCEPFAPGDMKNIFLMIWELLHRIESIL